MDIVAGIKLAEAHSNAYESSKIPEWTTFRSLTAPEFHRTLAGDTNNRSDLFRDSALRSRGC